MALDLGRTGVAASGAARKILEEMSRRNVVFFIFFIVILPDFVLSKENCNLRWTWVLGLNPGPPSEVKKQLKGGMGVGVPIFRFTGTWLRIL
jgi:hypothetical protein